ncbi:MAG: hypothetical protein ACKPB9_00130, partial [Dolichospermum sp.]
SNIAFLQNPCQNVENIPHGIIAMRVYLNNQDISKMPEDLRNNALVVLAWVNNSQSDRSMTRRGITGIPQLKQKVIKKRSNKHINSSEVSINSWKCERWNLTGWTVTRQK